MDVTKRDMRVEIMSKYFTKKTIPYWIIGVLVVLLGLVLLVHFNSNSNTGADTKTTGTTAKVQSSSSSTSNEKYVEGKDYTVKYSNTDLLSKSKLKNILSEAGVYNYKNLIERESNGEKRVSSVRAFFNQNLNWLIIQFSYDPSENNAGYSRKQFVYSINDRQQINSPGDVTDTDYDSMDNKKIVYDWENLVK
ncbi:hypothetical protein [Leuconostoc pseudomesenteroides]|uniref:hypothetical protein n=1 Tax=Leuconostoc pseudomesenteroides TaxID=33968 RepID=UPI0032DFA399